MSNSDTVSRKTQFQQLMDEELLKVKGIYYPVPVSIFHRLLVKKAPLRKLHPNPDDEFCRPEIGPNHSIISNYENTYRRCMGNSNANLFTNNPAFEPLQVQKISPDGYLILNGHHRWAAARLAGMKTIGIEILDLTRKEYILKKLQGSRHDKRVTMDLDEVVFCPEGSPYCEKAPTFQIGKKYQERIRLGIPALCQFLSSQGYDIWVYTARYYSMADLRTLFRRYHCPVTGFITGTARKGPAGADMKQSLEDMFEEKYLTTLHIDSSMVLQTFTGSKEFRDYPLTSSDSRWSGEVMDIVKRIEAEKPAG